MRVVIIDYDAGNIRSVSNALKRLGIEPTVSNKKEDILTADKLILPGVGAAGKAMQSIAKYDLTKVLKKLEQPMLGICLGMQLLCKSSEENDTECLGVFDTVVKKFASDVKVPHIGWNTVDYEVNSIFKNIIDNDYFYYVHSYYAELCKCTIAQTDYGIKYSAVLQKDNYYATQFHPEKSGEVGSIMLENFLKV